jgi:hypothetical protein
LKGWVRTAAATNVVSMAHTAIEVTFVVRAATNVSSTIVWVVETTLVGSAAPEPTPYPAAVDVRPRLR